MNGRLVALLAIFAFSGAANAQSPPPPPPENNSFEVVRGCLCGQQVVKVRHDEIAVAQQRYNDAKAKMDTLNQEVARLRPTVSADNPEQVEALRRLVETQDQATNFFFNTAQPNLQAVVARYNAATESYNRQCFGQTFDSEAVAQANAHLSCPPIP